MTDANGRTPAVGDYAAKARVGTITTLNESLGTATITFQDGSMVTYPASYLATAAPSPQPNDTWFWRCIGKMCGQ